MKTIYTIYMSDDGLNQFATKNVKALYNEILETGYKANNFFEVEDGQQIRKPFNYSNLLKTVKKRKDENHFYIAHIECDGGGTITINALNLL